MENYRTAVNEAEAVYLASGLTVKLTVFRPLDQWVSCCHRLLVCLKFKHE